MGVVSLLFFARLKEQVGKEKIELELSGPISLESLRIELEKIVPLGILQDKGVQVAVNGEIARDNPLIHDGDEVAFLPPFSGG